MKNIQYIDKFKSLFATTDDLVEQELSTSFGVVKILYIENMTNSSLIQNGIIKPLIKAEVENQKDIINFITEHILTATNPEIKSNFNELVHDILSGNCLIFIKNKQKAISVSAQGYEKRSIVEPPTSAVIKGPREGFTEDLGTNISLLRRRLKTSDLAVEKIQIGERGKNDVAIMYIEGIAEISVIAEIKRRLSCIKIDAIIDSFYLEEMLQEKNSSIFKQIGSSEKPDIVCSKLLEGRVAIITSGSPIVLTIPFILIEDLQSADDYYTHATRATFMRLIRVLGMMLGILLPGIYVATQIFHYRLLPINFLISLLDSVQNLAFPPLIEILFVLFLFEILSEASVRMPKHLGMALSIIGALVLGDTAVQAGLISPPAILVVAISGITIYTVPDQVGTLSIIRLLFTLIGGIAGYYGLLVGTIFLIVYISGMQSYGAPYLAPYAPNISDDKKDALLKKGLRYMKMRPRSIPNENKIRLKNSDSTEEGVGQ